jgi:YVTN family beta-propeller protein
VTVALDVATRKVVSKIPVGKAPKRVITVTMR